MKFSTISILVIISIFASCKTHYHVTQSQAKNVLVADSSKTNEVSAIGKYMQPLRAKLDSQMNEVIGEAMADFEKKKPNSSLGNLVVDAMYLKARSIDSTIYGAITNYGGIRIPEIKKGPITVGKIYEMLPFDNELVIVEVKGSDLEKWMNLIAESGGWPVQFRRSMSFDDKEFIMEVFITGVLCGNSETSKDSLLSKNVILKDSIYKIATNDYVANGGDNCDFLKNNKRINTGNTIRELTLDIIKQVNKISPNALLFNYDPKYYDSRTIIENRLLFYK